MNIIIRSGDAKKFMESIKDNGPFEFMQWGATVRIVYLIDDKDYPFKVLVNGVLQPNKRYLDLLRFVFDNRRDINRHVRKLQGKKQHLNHKYLNIERILFEEIYKNAYINYLSRPENESIGIFLGVEKVAKTMLPIKELEELKAEALEALQATKRGKKEVKEPVNNTNC